MKRPKGTETGWPKMIADYCFKSASLGAINHAENDNHIDCFSQLRGEKI